AGCRPPAARHRCRLPARRRRRWRTTDSPPCRRSRSRRPPWWRTCTPSWPGAAYRPRRPAAARRRAGAARRTGSSPCGASFEPSLPEEALGPEDEEEDEQGERERHRVLGTDGERPEALDQAEDQSAEHRPGHAAEAAQHADDEGLAEVGRRRQRRDRE